MLGLLVFCFFLLQTQDGVHFFFHRQRGIQPVDTESPSFHASEPRHLTLRKLMDGNLQLSEHLVVSEVSDDIFGDELILQTILYKVFGLYALPYQPSYLVSHAFVQTCLQATGDLLTTQFAVDVNADYQ